MRLIDHALLRARQHSQVRPYVGRHGIDRHHPASRAPAQARRNRLKPPDYLCSAQTEIGHRHDLFRGLDRMFGHGLRPWPVACGPRGTRGAGRAVRGLPENPIRNTGKINAKGDARIAVVRARRIHPAGVQRGILLGRTQERGDAADQVGEISQTADHHSRLELRRWPARLRTVLMRLATRRIGGEARPALRHHCRRRDGLDPSSPETHWLAGERFLFPDGRLHSGVRFPNSRKEPHAFGVAGPNRTGTWRFSPAKDSRMSANPFARTDHLVPIFQARRTKQNCTRFSSVQSQRSAI